MSQIRQEYHVVDHEKLVVQSRSAVGIATNDALKTTIPIVSLEAFYSSQPGDSKILTMTPSMARQIANDLMQAADESEALGITLPDDVEFK
ncbi:MAG TPA: hypothetical protein VJ742_13080 [Nitrososphaera sp.]|nr:hypothetical protein [Nitrososphaera sp.]